MRIRVARVVTALVILLNVLALYFIWRLLAGPDKELRSDGDPGSQAPPPKPVDSDVDFVEKSLTVVIRSFEHFERDLAGTIRSFLLLYPRLRVVVVCDSPLYPPLETELEGGVNATENVKVLNLRPDLRERGDLFAHVATRYVLFVPDSTRIVSKRILRAMVVKLLRRPHDLVAIPFTNGEPVKCLKVNLDIREWSIGYEKVEGGVCDAVSGKHATLLETATLRRLPLPTLLPFPGSLYVQTSARDLRVRLIRDVGLSDGRPLFRSERSRRKTERLDEARRSLAFRALRLKRVAREEGGGVEWYGCTRETQRCFASVVDDTPDYLWEGRWTPPCCLAGLRQTARHVFARLDDAGVRYWLEGGSLLGAMRAADILPWDYDVDIGIYLEDLPRCTWLLRARTHTTVDDDGFVWEKATEGDFYRVQYSAVNRLHVDIFPFYSRNGTMTKDTWFATHRQDREFPEGFLSPMSSIGFVGREVPAPNNIRDFLELKFGKGVVENPQYPNPAKVRYSPGEVRRSVSTSAPSDD